MTCPHYSLAAIGVGPAVCHGHDASFAMLQHVANFIWELAVGGGKNTLATLACARGIPCAAIWHIYMTYLGSRTV